MSPNSPTLAPAPEPASAEAHVRRRRPALREIPPPGAASAHDCTIESLCARLGPELLDVDVAPDGLGVRLAGVALADRRQPLRLAPGAVVLGVGVDDRHDDEACALLGRAAAAGAAALVLRRSAPGGQGLAALAHDLRVALLRAPRHTDWSDLHGLVRAVVHGDASEPLEWAPQGAVLTDLFALADALAATARGAVAIHDQQLRLLAYSHGGGAVDARWSATILERRAPEAELELLRRAGVTERLRGSDELLALPAEGESRARRVLAIRSEETLLGSIWLAEGAEPLDATADGAMRHCARLAMPQLLRARVAESLERRFRGNVLRDLLHGRSTAAGAAELELPREGAFTVIAYESGGRAPLTPIVSARLVDLLTMHVHSFRREAVVVASGERVHCLAHGADDGAGSCARLVRESLAVVESALHVSLAAGIGATVSTVDQVPGSRRGAEQALDVARRRGDRVVEADDVRAESYMIEFAEFVAARSATLSRPLQTLRDHDRAHATDYVETLAAYLRCLGDCVLAAADLHVHPNTLRYRLKRLVKLADVDLGSPDQRFELEVELRMLRARDGRA
jgi:hypothetical protein